MTSHVTWRNIFSTRRKQVAGLHCERRIEWSLI